MIRTILLTLITTIISLSASAQYNPEATLKQASDKLTSAKSIQASFSITGQGGIVNGTIVMSGSKFKMAAPQFTIWFDGHTQWTYAADQQETTVTTPTAEELQQINPLQILQSFRAAYRAEPQKAPSGTCKIKLTAKSADAAIRSAVVTLKTSTLYPESISLTLSNNTTANIKISGLKVGQTLPLSTFRYDSKTYPKAEIIDLR